MELITNSQNNSLEHLNYFTVRIEELGIKDTHNQTTAKFDCFDDYYEQSVPIFSANKHGDIEITYVGLNGLHTYLRGKKELPYKRIRVHPDRCINSPKYLTPRGAGVNVFTPPLLIDLYKNKKSIVTLVITEGEFKAFKACMHGIWCIGLQGIHNFHEYTPTGTILNSEIELLIRTCNVKNLILLFDSDCLDVDYKEESDLAKRPTGFYSAVKIFRELCKHLSCDVYFTHINKETAVKGLDDLLVAYKERENEVQYDLMSLKSTSLFTTQNITDKSLHKLKDYFHITNPEAFYNAYELTIADRPFIFNGSKYLHNGEKLELFRIAEASLYIRVGDDYYERVEKPDGNLFLKPTLVNRKKQTILDDYKKKAPNILEMIPKFKGFCNVPNHLNYQECITTPKGNWYNLYRPINHELVPGEITHSLAFAKHIFGEQLETGLDYLQLLFLIPTQALPILCLVSKENNTGKTTFLNWLKKLFRDNITICGSQEFGSEYNDDYITKVLVAIEETLLDKAAYKERMKAMSTAKTWKINAKWASRVEVDVYLKFILLSNNEDSFVRIDSEDIRFWVRKIPVISEENINMLDDLAAEAPAFLYYLKNRAMHYPKSLSRMWFPKEAIVTEALQKVVEASKPTIEKGIDSILKEYFMELKVPDIKMTALVLFQKLQAQGYRSFQKNYLEDTLKNSYKLQPNNPASYVYPEWKSILDEMCLMLIKDKGRYYTFRVEDFLSSETIRELGIIRDMESTKHEASQENIPF